VEQLLALLVLSILKVMTKKRSRKKAKNQELPSVSTPIEAVSSDATDEAVVAETTEVSEVTPDVVEEATAEVIADENSGEETSAEEIAAEETSAEEITADEIVEEPAAEAATETGDAVAGEEDTTTAEVTDDGATETPSETQTTEATTSEATEESATDNGDAEESSSAPKRKLALGGSIAIAAVSAALLSAWMVGPLAGTSAAIEKRPVVQLPKVDLNSLRSVDTYKQIESWAIDHVRMKPLAVSAVNNAIAAATKQSGSALVIQGARFSASREPELFSAEEFTARCRYPASLEKSRIALNSIRAAATQGNKQVLITVVPSKARTIGYLLGTRLNDLTGCAYNEDLVIAQLAQEYPDILKVVDPKRVLKYAPRDPYWSGDTHWTPMGGRALSELILAKVANVDLETARQILFDRTVPANKLVRGDLFRLLGLSKETATTRIATRQAYQLQITPRPFGTGSRVWGWTSPQPLEGATQSMLILHDSMVNVPRLTGQFGNVVPEGYDVHWTMAEDLPKLPQVQTVVLEFVDRTFLAKLLSFPSVDANVEDDTRMAAALTYLASS